MAGSGSGWFKTGPGAKSKIFVSVAAIKAYYGVSGADDVANKKAWLRDPARDPNVLMEEVVAIARRTPDQPAGQARRREWRSSPVSASIPQRDHLSILRLEDEMIADLRKTPYAKENLTSTTSRQIQDLAVNQMRKVIEESDVAIRIPQEVLSRVLTEGFRNQHATGTSGGELDSQTRKDAEHHMFGIPQDSGAGTYPIYGYLEPRVDPTSKPYDQGFLIGYGDIRIIFKDSVRTRTTFTTDDSLLDGSDDGIMPSPLGNPRLSSAGMSGLETLYRAAAEGVSTTATINRSGYWETQIHGAIGAADIARVEFTMGRPSLELQTLMDRLGIAWASIS